MHVGLNLVYLVPGYTGGTETYARELIPELVAAAPRMRFTAFINRESGSRLRRSLGEPDPGGDRACSCSQPGRVGPRRAATAATARQPIGSRSAPQPRQHSPGLGAVPARRDDSRSQLPARPRRPFGPAGTWHARPRAPGGTPLRPDHRRCDEHAAGSDAPAGRAARKGRCRAARYRCRASGRRLRRSREVRSWLDAGSRPIVLCVAAKRPHKNLMRLLGALALIPAERRPLLVLPGYPTAHEDDLRASGGELGVAGRHAFSRTGSTRRKLEGLYAPRPASSSRR